jgi:hypothetical protein
MVKTAREGVFKRFGASGGVELIAYVVRLNQALAEKKGRGAL